MKYSVFTVSTPDYTIEEALDKLKKYGYNGVEWRVHESLKEEPKELPPREKWYWNYNKCTVDIESIFEQAAYIKSICQDKGMEICGLATYLLPWEVEKIEMVLKAAVVMKCPRIRVNLPVYNKEANYNELFNKTKEAFKILEVLAKQYGVTINFEIHHGTIAPSASAAYRLVSNFNSKYIGVIYDAGNLVHEGFEQYKMGLEILGEYMNHVHIKSASWAPRWAESSEEMTWECKWSNLKHGQVNLPEFLEALKARGYEGYLSFEDFSNDSSTESKLKCNISYIKELIAKI